MAYRESTEFPYNYTQFEQRTYESSLSRWEILCMAPTSLSMMILYMTSLDIESYCASMVTSKNTSRGRQET